MNEVGIMLFAITMGILLAGMPDEYCQKVENGRVMEMTEHNTRLRASRP